VNVLNQHQQELSAQDVYLSCSLRLCRGVALGLPLALHDLIILVLLFLLLILQRNQ